MSGRRGGGGGSGRHHDYAGRVRQEINSVYNVYCRMFSAVKQQQTAGRLHADAESQIEGFRLDLAVATLVQSVDNLMRLCNELEELSLLQDAQVVNTILRAKQEALQRRKSELSAQLPEPFNALERTVDHLIDAENSTSS